MKVRDYLECDLMILDDLGTEMTTSFTVSALYQLVNTRLIESRQTIISTNLSDEEIVRRYGPQTASRLPVNMSFSVLRARHTPHQEGAWLMIMQHEITRERSLLDANGNIAEPGFARSALPIYSRRAVKAPAVRIKEWDYYLINNGRWALALTVADNGYMGLDSISFIDLENLCSTRPRP